MANANRKGQFRTTAGHDTDSEFERTIIQSLIDDKVSFEYEPKPPLAYHSTVSNGYCAACGSADVHQRRSYTPDVRLANGIYVEIKGYIKAENRTLIRAFVKRNPEIDLRFVFQRNNPWGKAGKRYTDFAAEIGCYSSVGRLPSLWQTGVPESLSQRRTRVKGGLCSYSEAQQKTRAASSKRSNAKVLMDNGGSVVPVTVTAKPKRALRNIFRLRRGGRSKRLTKARGASRAKG